MKNKSPFYTLNYNIIYIAKSLFIILTLILSAACSFTQGYQPFFLEAENGLHKAGFTSEVVKTDHFDLMVKSKIKKPNAPVVIYIEGDGKAWKSKKRISTDPTPKNPLVLSLALQDKRPNIVYIARPCQYVIPINKGRNCNNKYWSSHRFSNEVIKSTNQVIDSIATKLGTKSVELIGFSGGGAIAALVAKRRNDISLLRTIAGNLDHKAVNKYHNVSPLSAYSLNPIDEASQLKSLCQIHYLGNKDKIIPKHVISSYVESQGKKSKAIWLIVKDADHTKGWQKKWVDLLNAPHYCN